MAGAVEDSRDAVRFGQESGVSDGKADADAETLYAADDWTRLGEYDERWVAPGQVCHHDSPGRV